MEHEVRASDDEQGELFPQLVPQNNSSPSEVFTDRKLYVEFRVYFDPRTNQDLLSTLAEKAQEFIYDLFSGIEEETSGPLPSPHDVTYQLVMEAKHNG